MNKFICITEMIDKIFVVEHDLQILNCTFAKLCVPHRMFKLFEIFKFSDLKKAPF